MLEQGTGTSVNLLLGHDATRVGELERLAEASMRRSKNEQVLYLKKPPASALLAPREQRVPGVRIIDLFLPPAIKRPVRG